MSGSPTHGRAAGLFVAGTVLVFAVLCFRLLGRERGASGPDLRGETSQAASTDGFEGASGGLAVRLVPLRASVADRRSYADALRRRFGLGAGEPWRLEVRGALPASCEIAVVDRSGDVRLAARAIGEPHGEDPLATLFTASRLTEPEPGLRVVLWGEAPDEPVLVLEDLRVPLAARTYQPDELERALVVLSAPAASNGGSGPGGVQALQRENERLRAELHRERAERQEREREWIAYNRSVAELGFTSLAGTFEVDEELAPEAAEPPAEAASPPSDPVEDAPPDPRAERLEEIARSLRAFLVLADLKSYDLIEVGSFQEDGRHRGVGPVLFRLLDDRGRLAGSLSAALLRMEGSRSGRTVSLVLEDGYESHGGARTPFEGGVRRIPVPFLDPQPWFEKCPELFSSDAFADIEDEGLWDREVLRRDLNRLLATDTEAGWYRVRGIGGVVRDQLTDVQIEVLDSSGRLTRRLFADRMRMRPEPPGVVLLLENGVIIRGEEKAAFRDGRYRIYLPSARPEEWLRAAVPGFESDADEGQG